MPKISSKTSHYIKAIHIFFVAIWFGGIASWVPILSIASEAGYPESLHAHQNMIAIAHNVIGWGGIGTFVTGVLNAWLSHWGFLKHKWVTLKLLAIVPLILFGMFFMEASIIDNIDLLEREGPAALTYNEYLSNLKHVTYGAYFELAVFMSIAVISSVKPWSRWRNGKLSKDSA